MFTFDVKDRDTLSFKEAVLKEKEEEMKIYQNLVDSLKLEMTAQELKNVCELVARYVFD